MFGSKSIKLGAIVAVITCLFAVDLPAKTWLPGLGTKISRRA